jgi:hypothetical protein
MAATSTAEAQVNVFESGGLTVDAGAEAGLFYNTQRNNNFGIGRLGTLDSADSDTSENDVTYQEAYVKPSVYLNYDLGGSSIYGAASIVCGKTFGDGDPDGFTPNHPEDCSNEDLYIGYNSGDSYGDLGVDVSFGRQQYHQGRDYLWGYGEYSAAEAGLYWLSPRLAFHRTAMVKLTYGDWFAEGVWLQSKDVFAGSQREYAIGNLEYAQDWGTIGLAYTRVLAVDFSANTASFFSLEDANIYDIRYNGNPLYQMMPNWWFSAEYVWEKGDSGGLDAFGSPVQEKDADAWYVQLTYAFPEFEWAPEISYRFNHYSGDDPATASEDEAVDMLQYGFEDWGTWYHGEVLGEYAIFNSNLDVHHVFLWAYPYENLRAGFIFLNYTLDETNSGFQAGVTDDDFGNEINLIADWSVNDNMAISAVYGAWSPGGGAEQFYGGTDQTWHVLEAGWWLWF